MPGPPGFFHHLRIDDMSHRQPKCALRILNQTTAPARLRFRCGGLLVWDTWAAAGGILTVPKMGERDIQAMAILHDPRTGVAYSLPSTLARNGVRLVAAISVDQGAERFGIEQEACEHLHHLCLLNLTAMDVHCSLHFPESPFHMKVVVAPQAEQLIKLSDMTVTATVEGITLATLPIRHWDGDILISSSRLDEQPYPNMTFATSDAHGFPRARHVF